MGTTAVNAERGDIETIASCLQESLEEAKAERDARLSSAKVSVVTEV